MDDTLTIMPDKLSADNFLVTLNNCHSSVKFTMEIENDGMLRFLEHNCSINLLKFKPKSMSNQETLAFCFITRAMLMLATSAAY